MQVGVQVAVGMGHHPHDVSASVAYTRDRARRAIWVGRIGNLARWRGGRGWRGWGLPRTHSIHESNLAACLQLREIGEDKLAFAMPNWHLKGPLEIAGENARAGRGCERYPAALIVRGNILSQRGNRGAFAVCPGSGQ